mgnify:CR=1 FL=1
MMMGSAPALLQSLSRAIVIGQTDLQDEAPACEALFKRLAEEFAHSQPGRAEALRSHAMLLALWFVRRGVAPRSARRSQALRDTLLQRYRALLDRHFRAHEPVSFYASQLGVTADHLSRVCRANAGTSALDIMHERVLLEARRLLAYSNAPVADVGRDVGFEDPGYFSRFFVKLAGQSPSAYRTAIARGIGLLPDQTGPRA